VVNPNPDESLVVSLSDVLSDGSSVVVTADPPPTGDCDYAAGVLTVPAGGTATCDYAANDLAYSDDASAPTSNTASFTLNSILYSASDPIEWAVNQIRENATLTDDEIGLNESLTGHTQAGTYSFGPYTGLDSHTCSSDRADYFVGGAYTQMSESITNWAYVSSDGTEQDRDDATTTWTCDASFVDIYKTTNGQPADPTKDIGFVLYNSVGGFLESVTTLNHGHTWSSRPHSSPVMSTPSARTPFLRDSPSRSPSTAAPC